MAKRRFAVLLALLAFVALVAAIPSARAVQTVGVFLNDPGAFDGYTYFTANNYPTSFLIDNEGRLVHSWPTTGGLAGYLLEDGTLIRPSAYPNPRFLIGGNTGGVKQYDWDGNVLWQYAYSGDLHMAHHDVSVLPNGNVLILAWTYKTADEAIAAGRDPSLLDSDNILPESIVEVQPTGPTTGDIVWEWHSWDHLIQDFDNTKANYGVVEDHPELVDFNYTDPTTGGDRDWLHANALNYNADLDQIAISVRELSEIWIIDHGTTTAEAAGHTGGARGKGGDLLYRWGNPQVYRAGTEDDRVFYYQHNIHWIAEGLPGAGNMMVFNNGPRPEGVYSTVDEFVPPVDVDGNYPLTPGEAYGPAAPVWTYIAPTPTDFVSQFISSAGRLPNGNTLIDAGSAGKFFEVQSDGTVVWRYTNPVGRNGPFVQGETPTSNSVFRTYRYPADYPGFAGHDLTPGLPLEADSDSDMLSDIAEVEVYHTDPLLADTDGDGIGDAAEVRTYLTNPNVPDTDADGCSDGAETQTAMDSEMSGGRRDPLNEWDYFNPTGDGVNRTDDILAVIAKYGHDEGVFGDYDEKYDRTPLAGGEMWEFDAPNGTIRAQDILAAVFSYGHDCGPYS